MRFAASFLAGCLLLAASAVSQAAPTVQASPAMPLGHIPLGTQIVRSSTACVADQNTIYAGGWLGGGNDISLYKSTNGGATWVSWLTVTTIAPDDSNYGTELIYLPTRDQVGLAYIVWDSGLATEKIYFARFQQNGSPVGNAAEVSRPGDAHCIQPSAYVDAGGRIHCVYTNLAPVESGYDATIVYCHSDDGVTFGGYEVIAAFAIDGADAGNTDFFLYNPLANISGAYQDSVIPNSYYLAIAYASLESGVTYNLNVRTSENRGDSWSAPIPRNSTFNEYNPRVAVNTDFNILITAASHDPDLDRTRIVYHSYDQTAGAWNSSLPLQQQGTDNANHDVKADSTGLFHIVFENNGLLFYAQTQSSSPSNIGNYFAVARITESPTVTQYSLGLEMDINESQPADRYPVATWLGVRPNDPAVQAHISATAASFWDTAPSLPALLEFLMD